MQEFLEFTKGMKVQVAECYLEDEVTKDMNTTPTATVQFPPVDDEELVCIHYENGLMDYVPQDILEALPIGTCNRTGTDVYPTTVGDYAGYCPELDEDLYSFEFTARD